MVLDRAEYLRKLDSEIGRLEDEIFLLRKRKELFNYLRLKYSTENGGDMRLEDIEKICNGQKGWDLNGNFYEGIFSEEETFLLNHSYRICSQKK